MYLVYRNVHFGKDGIAVAAGCWNHVNGYSMTMELPTDHYDFIGPVNVKGKTADQIREEVKSIMEKQNV